MAGTSAGDARQRPIEPVLISTRRNFLHRFPSLQSTVDAAGVPGAQRARGRRIHRPADRCATGGEAVSRHPPASGRSDDGGRAQRTPTAVGPRASDGSLGFDP
jgi:hypothetical protein